MNIKIIAVLIVGLIIMATAYVVLVEEDDGKGKKKDDDEPPIVYPYEDVRYFTAIDPETNTTIGTTAWAVFNRTHGGNCCEHYLATTQEGWITNLGGEYPTWSEDHGLNWQDYRPITEPFDGLGEGSIVQAPNGDIIAMSWFPYSGDRFISFFYEASSGTWDYRENHWGYAPFYDRPWQVAVQGPITSLTGTYPWASIVVSNFWQDLVASYNGLDYFNLAEPDSAVGSVTFDLDFEPGPEYDYLTPHREMRATTIPTGGLLVPNYFGEGDSAFLQQDLTWTHHYTENGVPIPAQHLVIDSSGALHSVEAIDTTIVHHMSLDGGDTWTSYSHEWANASSLEEWEFQADGNLGIAAISIRVQDGNVDKDILFQIEDYRESMAADEITLIGEGDLDATSGAGNDVRFDFASLAILPDGTVIVAYMDTTDRNPLFAMELEVTDFEELDD